MQIFRWIFSLLAILAAGIALLGCGADGGRIETAHETEPALRQVVSEAGLAPLTAVPPTNPYQIALGRALFFETELSGNRDVSCATCHNPDFGLSDGLTLAIGTGGSGVGPERRLGNGRQFVPRNTPDVANRGLPGWETMFWDGRLALLEDGFISPAGEFLPSGLDNLLAAQAMLAVTARHEMRGGLYDVAGYLIQPGESPESYQNSEERPLAWSDQDIHGQANELAAFGNAPDQMPLIWEQLMARLMNFATYQVLFEDAYPDVPLEAMDFTYAANALAAFQMMAFTFSSTPWDRYLMGDDAALSPEAEQGALLFYGKAGCARCHAGDLLSDQQFHNIGAPQFGPGTSPIAPLDYGRYAVTQNLDDRFAFRTPSLRNVAHTAPYLHNGAYATLEDVICHHLEPERYLVGYHSRSLPADLRPTLQNETVTQQQILATLSPLLAEAKPLTNQEIRRLVAFLHTLSADRSD